MQDVQEKVFELHSQDYTVSEIAERLDLSYDTVLDFIMNFSEFFELSDQ